MAVDRKHIIDLMSQVQLQANEEGLIPAFGVLMNQLPAALWNNFAELLTHSVSRELLEPAQYLLMNAANECGYHTGHGVINSEEWKAIVAPLLEATPENIIHGAFAVFTAWGWGKAEIVELVPAERMVVRVYDYYESDVVEYGVDQHFIAYRFCGICAAVMDQVYGKKPYPDGFRTFVCTQEKGIECGDDYAEFVVTKAA